jgi:dTDP-3-amino-3,4,6-trideoxy-alpha-D-glucose transaminase
MIPFNDLKKHYESCKDAVDGAIAAVFKNGNFILGSEVKSFEQEFAAYVGVRFCVGVASGTEAIALSLLAHGIGRGDEVITADMTAFPTIAGIMQAGATPVAADIDPGDGLLDSRGVESKVTARTRAIVAVHLYGQCCDMDALAGIARGRNLVLIEDAAQAAGSLYKGRKAGSLGECAAFSFYPTKNLGAFGDGGAITTDSEAIYQALTMLRNYGQSRRYYHDMPGINSRLDELQAAILRVKLPRLDAWNARRRVIAGRYRSALKSVSSLVEREYGIANNHLYVVRHKQRDALRQYLESRGIQTLIHYPVPVSAQKAFPGPHGKALPDSGAFADTIVSLPLYPELDDNQIETIIEVVNGFNG